MAVLLAGPRGAPLFVQGVCRHGLPIGVVHWEALDVIGDGEGLHLAIPAYFQEHHIPYLNGVLASRLGTVFGEDDPERAPAGEGRPEVHFRLDAGELVRTERSAQYNPGTIVIGPVSEPWPDAKALRSALEEAFVEAGEVEIQQRTHARALRRHLRLGDASS
jgi:virulence-associated protein VagC